MANTNKNKTSRFRKLLSKFNPRSRPIRTTRNWRGQPKMAVALPLYIYPSASAWAPIIDAVAKFPDTTFGLIINPSDGPGGSVPDSSYIQYVSQLNSYSNVDLFGYVYTSYGKRDIADIEADVNSYAQWANYTKADIHMSGIFLDEAPSDTTYVDYISNVSYYAKSIMTKGDYVWINPGTPVSEDFYDVVDFVNAIENTYDYWTSGGGKSAVSEDLRDRTTVMLHSYNSTAANLYAATSDIIGDGYAAALITTDTGYQDFSSLWTAFLNYVESAGGNSTNTDDVDSSNEC